MISYSINGNLIYEGCGLEKNGELYYWNCTERGQKTILKYFESEKQAIKHAP